MKQLVKSFLNKAAYSRTLRQQIEEQRQQIEKQGTFPAGHYYSPIPDKDEILTYIESRKPLKTDLLGIKLNKDRQFGLLNEYVQFYKDLPFPKKQKPDCRYYYDNDWYSYPDAIFLYSFLRKHKPKRIIEIGSGFHPRLCLIPLIDSFHTALKLPLLSRIQIDLKPIERQYEVESG
jgi:hypothetical protein